MKIALLVLLLQFFTNSSLAKSTEVAEKNINEAIKQQVQVECPSCEVEVTLHNKILIADIEKPDAVIADHWKGQTNLLLKMGEKHRVITATIRWKDNVVVAKKNIKQGFPITSDDVRVVNKDVTYMKAAYVQKPEDVIGWEGKRIFTRGQAIDENILRKPIVVKYGQPIKIHLQEGSLSLSMNGQAKGAGAIGDRIPVIINKTRTKVSGKIVGKNSVRIE